MIYAYSTTQLSGGAMFPEGTSQQESIKPNIITLVQWIDKPQVMYSLVNNTMTPHPVTIYYTNIIHVFHYRKFIF